MRDVCPICGRVEDHVSARYNNCVCATCQDQYPALTAMGEVLTFSNVDWTGGFVSYIRGVRTPSPQHRCYIRGIPCYADEARFGGIVIQAATPPLGGENPQGVN